MSTPKNKRIPSPVSRSSERIRQKSRRRFVMPTRDEVVGDIPDLDDDFVSPEKCRERQNFLRIKRESHSYKPVSNFTRVHNSYNRDRFSGEEYSDESDMDNFLANDSSEDSVSDSDEEDNGKAKKDSSASADELVEEVNKSKSKFSRIKRALKEVDTSTEEEEEETAAMQRVKRRKTSRGGKPDRSRIDSSSGEDAEEAPPPGQWELSPEEIVGHDSIRQPSDSSDAEVSGAHCSESDSDSESGSDEASGSDDDELNVSASGRPSRRASVKEKVHKAYEAFRMKRNERIKKQLQHNVTATAT